MKLQRAVCVAHDADRLQMICMRALTGRHSAFTMQTLAPVAHSPRTRGTDDDEVFVAGDEGPGTPPIALREWYQAPRPRGPLPSPAEQQNDPGAESGQLQRHTDQPVLPGALDGTVGLVHRTSPFLPAKKGPAGSAAPDESHPAPAPGWPVCCEPTRRLA